MAPPDAEPLVSVILATCNRAGWLAGAVESVLAQDYPALELVVVDDGSTDDTRRVLEPYRQDRRVLYLANEQNRGLAFSLNRGIEAARGMYLARIDDDDRWTDPRKISEQVRHMNGHPECGLLGTAYVDEWGGTAYNPLDDGRIRSQMLFRCPFCHSSVLLRAQVLAEVGGYDEGLEFAEDWDLWMRVGRRWGMANLAAVTVMRGTGEGALTERFFTRQASTARALLAQYGREYPGRWRAFLYHLAVESFFRLASPGSRLHRALKPVFEAVFGLRSGSSSAKNGGQLQP